MEFLAGLVIGGTLGALIMAMFAAGAREPDL